LALVGSYFPVKGVVVADNPFKANKDSIPTPKKATLSKKKIFNTV
jgi:hypothetical protein